MPIESDAELREILGIERIAVVGCSRTPGKDAHDVPRYMRDHGYEILPINPNAETIFGRPAADSLSAVPDSIELVNVFRPSAEVAGIVDEAIERGDVRVIWTQVGIRDDEAARRFERTGGVVVQDRCLKVEHHRVLA